MAGPTGLNGLSGIAGLQVTTDGEAYATPEERLGGPADPRHAQWGEQAHPYAWESSMAGVGAGTHGPYGPENQMLDDIYWWLTPGGDESEDVTMDKTPNIDTQSHAAPWPQGIASGAVPSEGPDQLAYQRQQSMKLHGIKTNAGVRSIVPPQALGVQQDEWAEIWEVNPGFSNLVDVPNQIKVGAAPGGFGHRDRTQSAARQNGYDFGSKHIHRRYATGSVPGNTMWMRPGGRPMAKSLAGPARPAIGPDSPFSGDDLGATFSPDGAILNVVPSEYVAPPQPILSSASQQTTGDDAIVEWY